MKVADDPVRDAMHANAFARTLKQVAP
jgi:hypothetical protein